MIRIRALCRRAMIYTHIWMRVLCIYWIKGRGSFQPRKMGNDHLGTSSLNHYGGFRRNLGCHMLLWRNKHDHCSRTLPPNAYNVKSKPKMLVLAIDLGSLTGFAGAGVVACVMMAAVIYINTMLLIKESISI